MNNYTIYYTLEQAKKALKLGAPIDHHENACTTNSTPHFYIGERGNYQKGYILYIIPTAEEMVGWLEEQGFYFRIETTGSSVEIDAKCIIEIHNSTRKEATLAAIDAALEYLTNKNK